MLWAKHLFHFEAETFAKSPKFPPRHLGDFP